MGESQQQDGRRDRFLPDLPSCRPLADVTRPYCPCGGTDADTRSPGRGDLYVFRAFYLHSPSWAATWGVCCGTHMIFPTGPSMISDPVTPTLNAITAERINVPSRDTGLRHCSRRCTLRRFGPHQTN